MRAPLHDPIMAGFVAQLAHINAVADASPGFVWRLQTEDGDATAVRAFDDERILVNMSLWESLEALHAYVYRSAHVGPLRERRQWFEPMEGPVLVLWWIEAGHVPTVLEAKQRLAVLAANGPTPEAFTFRQPFPPPGGDALAPPEIDSEFCDRP
jgi:hypothetical protein